MTETSCVSIPYLLGSITGKFRAWNATHLPHSLIHAYYTPKRRLFQAFFPFLTIFVDYALFLCQYLYVNLCNQVHQSFIIFNYFSRYRGIQKSVNTKYGFASFLSCVCSRVIFIYLLWYFVQINEISFFFSRDSFSFFFRRPKAILRYTHLRSPARSRPHLHIHPYTAKHSCIRGWTCILPLLQLPVKLPFSPLTRKIPMWQPQTRQEVSPWRCNPPRFPAEFP